MKKRIYSDKQAYFIFQIVVILRVRKFVFCEEPRSPSFLLNKRDNISYKYHVNNSVTLFTAQRNSLYLFVYFTLFGSRLIATMETLRTKVYFLNTQLKFIYQ